MVDGLFDEHLYKTRAHTPMMYTECVCVCVCVDVTSMLPLCLQILDAHLSKIKHTKGVKGVQRLVCGEW